MSSLKSLQLVILECQKIKPIKLDLQSFFLDMIALKMLKNNLNRHIGNSC